MKIPKPPGRIPRRSRISACSNGESSGLATAAWLSFWLLANAVKVLPVGTAYAAWTGIGAVGAALLGMLLFKEPATAARIACIVLIVAGIAGLKVLGGEAGN